MKKNSPNVNNSNKKKIHINTLNKVVDGDHIPCTCMPSTNVHKENNDKINI